MLHGSGSVEFFLTCYHLLRSYTHQTSFQIGFCLILKDQSIFLGFLFEGCQPCDEHMDQFRMYHLHRYGKGQFDASMLWTTTGFAGQWKAVKKRVGSLRLPSFPSIKFSQSRSLWLPIGIHKILRPMVPFLQGTPSHDFLGWRPIHRMPGPSHKARQLAWKYGRGASCKNAIENIHGEAMLSNAIHNCLDYLFVSSHACALQCCNLPSIKRRSMEVKCRHYHACDIHFTIICWAHVKTHWCTVPVIRCRSIC